MVTTVSDTLFNRLIDAFPADRAYAPEEFSREPMPASVQTYLDARVTLRFEKLELPADEWVDLDHPDVREAGHAYQKVLAKHLRIPASDWRNELKEACRTVASYLIRPAATLTDIVFSGGATEASLDDVSARLRPFSDYAYFGEVIGAYFEQKNLDRIDRERFAGLVRRIDQQMTRDFDADEWIKLLQPLLSLVRKVPEFSGGIPADVLRTFLEEKNADVLKKRLDAHVEAKDTQLIKDHELRELFEPQADVEERPSEKPTAESRLREPAQHGGSVPLWKQYESGTRAAPTGSAMASSGTRGDTTPAPATEGQPLWKQFRKREEPSAQRKESGSAEPRGEAMSDQDALASLERSVLGERGSRNRSLFLKHLFSGSTEDYEHTLRELDEAESWSEASQVIAREVFLKHQVNIYSDPAVAFTDAAEARYRS